MKKQLFAAFALLTAAACQSEPVEIVSIDSEEITTIHAVCSLDDESTKTVRQDDGKVFWSPGEEISVFQGHLLDGGAKFTSTNTAVQATADFKGVLPSSSGNYWALYPYDQEAFCSNGNYVVTHSSIEQTAVAGSFPDDLYISIARSATTDMVFKHPLGGIKFSVVTSGIKKITMISNGGEDIFGDTMALDFDSDNNPFVGACWNPSDKISLVPADGGTFIPGEAYYFITIPVTMYSGFSLLMERNDGTVYTRSVDKSVTVSRASFRTLMEADKGSTWSKPVLTYSPDNINISAYGGTCSITVTYMGNYHLDVSGAPWITEDGTEGDPKFGCKHYFRVAANTGVERQGVITVCDENNCYPIIVTQGNGTSLKTITHHSLGMRFTATWCGHCPKMNEAFSSVKSSLENKFEIVNFHALNSNLPFSDSNPIMNQYQISGFPTGIVDGRVNIPNYTNPEYTAQVVKNAINETESTYPAQTSAGISSTLSGRHIDVNAKVYLAEPGDYKITVLLLESGVVAYQADFTNGAQNNYVHNYLARMTLSSSILGDSFSSGTGDTTKEFNYSADIPESYNTANMSVLVYIQRPFGSQKVIQSDNYGDWYIDNCRSASVGASVEPEVQ